MEIFDIGLGYKLKITKSARGKWYIVNMFHPNWGWLNWFRLSSDFKIFIPYCNIDEQFAKSTLKNICSKHTQLNSWANKKDGL